MEDAFFSSRAVRDLAAADQYDSTTSTEQHHGQDQRQTRVETSSRQRGRLRRVVRCRRSASFGQARQDRESLNDDRASVHEHAIETFLDGVYRQEVVRSTLRVVEVTAVVELVRHKWRQRSIGGARRRDRGDLRGHRDGIDHGRCRELGAELRSELDTEVRVQVADLYPGDAESRDVAEVEPEGRPRDVRFADVLRRVVQRACTLGVRARDALGLEVEVTTVRDVRMDVDVAAVLECRAIGERDAIRVHLEGRRSSSVSTDRRQRSKR